mgnify:CR=1 FL=1
MAREESENVYHEQYKKINICREPGISAACHACFSPVGILPAAGSVFSGSHGIEFWGSDEKKQYCIKKENCAQCSNSSGRQEEAMFIPADLKIFRCGLACIRLMRPSHMLKSALVFLPCVFSRNLFDPDFLIPAMIAFISFSSAASSIYILNDIYDAEKDRRHPQKCHRPVASGAVSVFTAKILCAVMMAAPFVLDVMFSASHLYSCIIIAAYLILNIGYSIKWKNVAILDVAILASGFVLRTLYGGIFCGIQISPWLFLCILSIALYMGLGKRYGELRKLKGAGTRPVLKFYTRSFLEKNMYLSAGTGIIFYSLWTFFSNTGPLAMSTVPFVILSFFRYNLIVDTQKSDGNPVSLILTDIPLLLFGSVVAVLLMIQLYGDFLYELIFF